jgi:hypothetical protein
VLARAPCVVLIALVVCAALPLAQAEGLSHRLTERHVRCAEHGDIEHAAALGYDAPAAHGGVGALPRDGHDGCGLHSLLREAPARSAAVALPLPLPPTSAPAVSPRPPPGPAWRRHPRLRAQDLPPRSPTAS